MPTRLEQLNAAAKNAQEKRDAIAQEQKALAQKLNAEKRKQRNKRIFNWVVTWKDCWKIRSC